MKVTDILFRILLFASKDSLLQKTLCHDIRVDFEFFAHHKMFFVAVVVVVVLFCFVLCFVFVCFLLLFFVLNNNVKYLSFCVFVRFSLVKDRYTESVHNVVSCVRF